MSTVIKAGTIVTSDLTYKSDVLVENGKIYSIGKNISIKTDSIEFTGELTPIFLEKLFFRMSNNIASDFSSPEIPLLLSSI